MSRVDLDYHELISSIENFEQATEKTESIINNIIHNSGADLIKSNIYPLIHNSGREWKGKPKHAKEAKSLTDVKENLGLITKSKKTYSYLWFADDGSNTERHQGNQQFMLKGVEKSIDEISNKIIQRIIQEINN